MRRPSTLAFLVALLLPGHGAAAPQKGSFDEETTVTVVEIPVQVLDNGEPVRGLTRDSFVVKADGRRQEIIGFDIVDLSQAPPDAGAAPEALGLAARRQFLLFDLSFSDPSSIERARQAAAALVESGLHPTDLVGVAMYRAARGAEMVLGFTTDRGQLGRALDMLSPAQPLLTSRDPLSLVLSIPVTVVDGAADARSG